MVLNKRYIPKIITALILMVASPVGIFGANNKATDVKKPDFAFPQEVNANAERQLSAALSSGNDIKALRALIDMTIARGIIASDNLQSAYNKIESARESMTDPAVKALSYLLQAQILDEFFDLNANSYNERKLPPTPLPADWTEWSGDQFRSEIKRLVKNSLSDPDPLRSIATSQYIDLITTEPQTLIYFPTMFDVVTFQAIDMLQSITNFYRDKIPQSLIAQIPSADRTPLTVKDSPDPSYILGLYSSLLKANSDRTAPYVFTLTSLMDFLQSKSRSNASVRADIKSLYLSLFKKYYPVSEYSGDLLLGYMNIQQNDTNEKLSDKDRYKMLTDFIAKYPNYWNIGCLKNEINNLTKPALNVNYPTKVEPGMTFTAKVSALNISDAYIKIYRLERKSSKFNDDEWGVSGTTPVAQRHLSFNRTLPFNVEENIDFILPEPGYYYLFSSLNPDEKPVGISVPRGGDITCTSVALAAVSTDDAYIYSLNPFTGQPIENVSLYYKDNKKRVDIGNTGKSATFHIEKDGNAMSKLIYPSTESDSYGLCVYVDDNSMFNNNSSLRSVTLTDLPLYHPGDSIGWETIIYQYSGDKDANRIVPDLKLKAYLMNANAQIADSLEISTDMFGRASGSFFIPKGELTGFYRIYFKTVDKSVSYANTTISGINVEVSDYKLPTFKIDIQTPRMDTPAKGDVTITGQVISYSGFGLQNAETKLTVSALGRSRYWNDQPDNFFIDSLSTGSDGFFSFVIPAAAMDGSNYPDGLFRCSLTSTSPAGESQSAQTTFSRSNYYSVFADLTDTDYVGEQFKNIFEISRPVAVNVMVRDSEMNDTDLSVRLTVAVEKDKKYNDTVFTKILPSGSSKIDLSSLSPGDYRFTFTLADDSLKQIADSAVSYHTLFKLKSSQSPSTAPVWSCMPKHNRELKKGEKAKIYFAVPTGKSSVIYTTSSKGEIIESRWIKANAGMNEITASIPDGSDELEISFMAFRDFISATCTHNISLAEEKLELKCESFRDNLIPGQNETWTFHTVNSSGSPVKSALALRLFSEQLNALRSSTFGEPFMKWNYSGVDLNSIVFRNNGYSRPQIDYKNYKIYPASETRCESISVPEINTYGQYFVNKYFTLTTGATNRGRIMYKSAMSAPKASMSADEMMVESAEVPVTAFGIKGVVSGLRVEEGSADLDDLSTIDDDLNMSDAARFQYRDQLSPLAFFKPLLSTDSNGELSFTFTVPDGNTTWLLNAFAFTETLQSATLNQKFIANKPVMVSPNLPRFLRTGDIADISSLVINNSEKTQIVLTTTELFNPLSGEIIGRFESTDTVAAKLSIPVTVRINTPVDATAIGFRIKSSTPEFADGEQSLISILPSFTPVIETTPFYISPDSTHFITTIPQIGSDARVTLEYCDNPTWYVVTALPGLRKEKISTADQAADAIFSAAIADGLLRNNPSIAGALREWNNSEKSDSTLTSMLQRNSDLKTMLLKATPWMVDAMTDTERMQRLSLLFDRSEIEAAYTEAIDLLKRLNQPDGGWAWFGSIKETSLWSTRNCLYTLGKLNRLGFLPDNESLKQMIASALSWYEKETVKMYEKYPRGSYIDYVSTLDLWPDHKHSLTSDKIIRSEIQTIVKNWKKYSVARKANSSILLKHHGYDKLARTLIESIIEFSKSTPTQGLWWPSIGEQYGGSMIELQASANVLCALKEVTPESKYIDPVRQWLILQKEARNWGSGAIASDVIYSILSTSPEWIEKAGSATIFVGDQKVPFSYTDSTLGYFRSNITDLNPSLKTLEISKSALSPSWGAIYSQSTMTMADIKASGCDAVSIEKRLLVKNGNDWVFATEPLKVGDRVKIQLLIHANQTMQYIAVDDDRAACLEPVEQLPAPIYSQGICFYRENRDSATNLFVTNMPKGTYMLEYEMFVNNSGDFSSGIATIQSQYAPELTAHSAGNILRVSGK